MVQNKSLVLAKHPVGYPVPGSDLITTSSEFDLNQAPPPGGLIVKTNYLSFDPYQRGRMRAATGLYTTGYPLNSPITNNAILTVLSSDNPRFKAGDVITTNAEFSEYQIITKERAELEQSPGGGNAGVRLLKNPLGLDPKLFLGALGMSGLTAYSSLYEIGKPKKGEVIFISAASGAVGQVVGQLAKREGLKVIGSVGSDEKLQYIKEELGFDAGFNYKKEKPDEALNRILGELGEEGLNIYYDNVGGEQLDAALGALSTFGRIGESAPLLLNGIGDANVIQYLVAASLKPAKSLVKLTVSRICRLLSARG
jgi:NADPH-dependent curcumin reductase CurA